MASQKLTEETWKEKRIDTKLGLESMIQGIEQLLVFGVLVNAEKNQLDTVYESRTEKSKEEYYGGN